MRLTRLPLFVALFAGLSLLVLSMIPPADAQKAGTGKDKDTPVGVDRVVRQSLNQTVPVIGRLVASEAGAIAARASGAVESFRVDVGDRVAKGEIIVTLVKDAVRWSYELRKAETAEKTAALKSAGASLAIQRQELKRLKSLQKSAAFSQARYEDKRQGVIKAEGEAARAEANVQSARANLKLAEINLYNMDVRAPYAGVISEKRTAAGAYVSLGQATVSMVADKNLEIEAAVPSQRARVLEPGKKITARLDDKNTFTATVRAVVPEENPLTRTRTVRFLPQFKTEIEGLALNQSVTLSLPAGSSETQMTVHKDAVLNRQGKTIVFVAKDGAVKLRPVQLGEAMGGRFIVKGGLSQGDLVVVRGNERLRPGQKVSYRNDKK